MKKQELAIFYLLGYLESNLQLGKETVDIRKMILFLNEEFPIEDTSCTNIKKIINGKDNDH